MESYFELGKHYTQLEDQTDAAISAFQKGHDVAASVDDKNKQFSFLQAIGLLYYYPKDNYAKSLVFLLQAEQIIDESFPLAIKAEHLSHISEVYRIMGKFTDGLDYQLRALQISESVNDTSSWAMGLRNMGRNYWSQGHYDLALDYFLDALDLFQLARDSVNAYISIASAAETYSRLGKLDTAIVFARQAKALANQIQHTYGVAYADALMGSLNLKKGAYDEGLSLLSKSAKAFEGMGIKKEFAETSLDIARGYNMLGQPQNAIDIIGKINPIAEEIQDLALKRDISDVCSESYQKMGDPEQAYFHLRQYIRYKDSLLNEQKLMEIADMRQKYEMQEQAQTIASLQQKTESSQRQLYIYAFISGIAFLLFLLWLVYYRNKSLKDINQVLALKNEEIRLQNERLANSNEDLRQFAHVASHDLREPLRSIGSFATLLERRYRHQLDDDADEFISFITKGVDRMDSLLADLMAYSVVGIFEHEYSRVNIAEVITQIIENLKNKHATQGARISIHNLPVITANQKQIFQLFEHLIDNAIKFRSEEKPEISITCERKGGKYLFAVKDNGIGMDEVYKDKIFGLFLRLHNKKSKYKGTGIGLSICKKIVEQHKGKIWIESQVNEGTTVFFILPESPIEDSNGDLYRKFKRWTGIS